ncbi:class I SAM-dependent methyltransferase, partial [Sulfurimonas sp. MAG313]
ECYQNLEQQKERYNLHENNAEDEGYRAYFQRFLDFTLPQTKDVKSALDFGCGRTSLLATLLEKEGIKCDYYDPIYHPNTLSDSKKYEFIVSTEVFEHLHQPKVVFEDLVSRLEEGGVLALQTEFHSNKYETFKKWWYPQDPTHIVFFRAKTFEVLAEMFGCEVLSDNGKNMIVMRKMRDK